MEESSDNNASKHDALFRKITNSGPEAFDRLIEICETDFWDVAEFLASFQKSDSVERNVLSDHFESTCNLSDVRSNVERDGNIFSNYRQNSIENITLEPYIEEVDKIFVVEKAVRFCSRNIMAYPMKSKNRGVLFLVNIVEINKKPEQYRNGAMLDKNKMISLFRQFGFKIFYYENITLQQFRQLVDELTDSQWLRATDCLVFCVLSHGCFINGHQMIQFSDGKNGSIEDILVKFSNQACPKLIRKPKIFIFPMCRGTSSGIKVKTFNVPNVKKGDKLPAFSDIKICYGSVRGFETFRDGDVGS
ncbi:Caspase Dronc, partial [Pseudolycoriella hygida]